jgi:HemY protein
MTRALLWLLAALAFGAVAGQLILDDPGYLLVTWHQWVLETSVWIALAGVAIVFLAILFALGLLDTLVDAVSHWQQRRIAERERQARQLTEKGLAQYAEAEWRKATSTLMKAAELVDAPLLVRLTCARAAEEEGRIDLAEQILREARAQAGEASALVDIRIASLRLRHGDAAGARVVLEKLREHFPKHPRALRLLAEVYQQLGAWQALTAILPALKKLMRESQWLSTGRLAWTHHLGAIAAEAGYPSRKARIDAMQGAWKSAPSEFRADETIVAAFADVLVRLDAMADAQGVLERAINTAIAGDFSDSLIARYGRLDAEKPEEQLVVVEKWLTMRPTHPALLLAAGRISLRNRLWGKARDYFEASAARQATAESCAELVRLYTRLGENTKADQYLRRHAELTGMDLPKLPLPTARV